VEEPKQQPNYRIKIQNKTYCKLRSFWREGGRAVEPEVRSLARATPQLQLVAIVIKEHVERADVVAIHVIPE